jgi:hypothetical protein
MGSAETPTVLAAARTLTSYAGGSKQSECQREAWPIKQPRGENLGNLSR